MVTLTDEQVMEFAERVARTGAAERRKDWSSLPEGHRQGLTTEAEEWLVLFHHAGLIVAELPEPDDWVVVVGDDGEDTTTPYWRTSWGESVTAWIEGVETPAWSLREDLDDVRADALKMLAAVAACERFRAQRQSGDDR